MQSDDDLYNEQVKVFLVALYCSTAPAISVIAIDPIMNSLVLFLFNVLHFLRVMLSCSNIKEQTGTVMVLLLLFSYCYVYYMVNRSKQFFITNKRLQIMMTEQRKIIKNLPDGVLICKQVASRSETDVNDFS